ncbi:EpsG family protein [Leuconostoc falkenbergense]|uniref:EpsG family protein n=1 Tax=Leuconostoc falkenbergense TaxID=2766470 RepID=UPI0024AD42E3|nr:EpsG family protein [Leuconostoc falkenbergense]MDI6667228.1 EpsG family protein [Leuconostoc falkenbergense]
MILFAVFFSNLLGLFTKRIQYLIALLSTTYFIWIASSLRSFLSFDTNVYQETYSFPVSSKVYEVGYLWLSNFFYQNNYSYEQFRLITFSVAYLVFFVAVIRLTKQVSLFMMLYLFFPFLNDVSNVRNTFMIFIVFLASTFMVKKRYIPIAVGLILLSTTMQTTGYLYLLSVPLIMLPLKKLIKFSQILLVLAGVVFFMILVAGHSSLITNALVFALSHSTRGNIDQMVGAFSGGTLKVRAVGIFLAYLFEMLVFYRYILKHGYSDQIESKIKIMFVFSVIGMLGVPAVAWNLAFERILRNTFIFFIGAVSLVLSEKVPDVGLDTHRKNMQMMMFLVALLIIVEMASQGYFFMSSGNRGFYVPYMLHWK